MNATDRRKLAVRCATEAVSWLVKSVHERAVLEMLTKHLQGGHDQQTHAGEEGGEENDEPAPKMTWDRAKEIGTHGGCGELAAAILDRVGGVPLLRYDKEGTAVHAAVKVDGELVHLGDNDERLVEVTREELDRARKEDFMPERVNIEEGELDAIIDMMFGDKEPSE